MLVVEHDEDTMLAADCIVDIGPGAGEHGGNVVAVGTAKQIMKCKDSITGAYLSGRKQLKEYRRFFSLGRDDLCDRSFRFWKKLFGKRDFV